METNVNETPREDAALELRGSTDVIMASFAVSYLQTSLHTFGGILDSSFRRPQNVFQ